MTRLSIPNILEPIRSSCILHHRIGNQLRAKTQLHGLISNVKRNIDQISGEERREERRLSRRRQDSQTLHLQHAKGWQWHVVRKGVGTKQPLPAFSSPQATLQHSHAGIHKTVDGKNSKERTARIMVVPPESLMGTLRAT